MAAEKQEPRAPICISWEEWKASRAAKRENLRRLGLDAPSRRSESTSDRRLRAAFNWTEARRLADLPDFKVLPQLERMRSELSDGR